MGLVSSMVRTSDRLHGLCCISNGLPSPAPQGTGSRHRRWPLWFLFCDAACQRYLMLLVHALIALISMPHAQRASTSCCSRATYFRGSELPSRRRRMSLTNPQISHRGKPLAFHSSISGSHRCRWPSLISRLYAKGNPLALRIYLTRPLTLLTLVQPGAAVKLNQFSREGCKLAIVHL